MDPKDSEFLIPDTKERVRNRPVLSDAKGVSLPNLADHQEDPDFPEVFYFKTEEIKLYLRLSWMLAGKFLWTELDLEALDILLMLGYQEWYLELPVTSNLNNEENYQVYLLFEDIINNSKIEKGIWYWDNQETKLQEYQALVNSNATKYGHLTYRHFTSEQSRKDLWNTIMPRILKYRTLQKGKVPSGRPGKSSEYSSHASTDTGPVRYPSPRVRDYEISELKELIVLTPQERKRKVNASG
jgi:hypothetical protein